MDIRTEFKAGVDATRAVQEEVGEMETSRVSIVTPIITGVLVGSIAGVMLRGVLRLAFGRE